MIPGIIRQKKEGNFFEELTKNGISSVVLSTSNTSRGGLMRNLFQMICYLVFLTIIPGFMLVCIAWGLMQVKRISSNIYAPTFGIADLFESSSTEFWIDHIPSVWIFYTFLVLGILFFCSGLAELICFIATDEEDTGRYPVVKSWLRWVISGLFFVMLCLYIALYVAYFGVVLLWCILGAILNPQTFLPLASGASVIFGCIFFFYTTITKVENQLDQIVNKVIDEQLQIIVANTLKNNDIISKMIDTVEELPQATFNNAVNFFFIENNLPKVDRQVTDEILKGNVNSLAIVLNSCFGIAPEISQGIVGAIINRPLMISDAVYAFAKNKGIDAPYIVDLVDILYYNLQNDIDKKEVLKNTVVISKKIIKQIFPNFKIELGEIFIKIFIERDLDPIRDIMKAHNLPVEILEIIIAHINDDNVKLQENLKWLAQKFLPPKYFHAFMAVNKLATNDIFGNDYNLETILQEKFKVPVELIYALFSRK